MRTRTLLASVSLAIVGLVVFAPAAQAQEGDGDGLSKET